ncbi:unnamed protein product [Closterium sp. Naga37s-1]|nr:unnamed protein product [Closterium sp. Naga37s-1]
MFSSHLQPLSLSSASPPSPLLPLASLSSSLHFCVSSVACRSAHSFLAPPIPSSFLPFLPRSAHSFLSPPLPSSLRPFLPLSSPSFRFSRPSREVCDLDTWYSSGMAWMALTPLLSSPSLSFPNPPQPPQVCDPDTWYCSGMGWMALTLLSLMAEEDAFLSLLFLMHRSFPLSPLLPSGVLVVPRHMELQGQRVGCAALCPSPSSPQHSPPPLFSPFPPQLPPLIGQHAEATPLPFSFLSLPSYPTLPQTPSPLHQVCDPDTWYCSGMGWMALTLLSLMAEEDAFLSLLFLMHRSPCPLPPPSSFPAGDFTPTHGTAAACGGHSPALLFPLSALISHSPSNTLPPPPGAEGGLLFAPLPPHPNTLPLLFFPIPPSTTPSNRCVTRTRGTAAAWGGWRSLCSPSWRRKTPSSPSSSSCTALLAPSPLLPPFLLVISPQHMVPQQHAEATPLPFSFLSLPSYPTLPQTPSPLHQVCDPDTWYCSGMGWMALTLLSLMAEEDAFLSLLFLMHRCGLRGLFAPNMHQVGVAEMKERGHSQHAPLAALPVPGRVHTSSSFTSHLTVKPSRPLPLSSLLSPVQLNTRLSQLSQFLAESTPRLHSFFEDLQLKPSMYAADWLLSLFARHMPQYLVYRVFDIVLAERTMSVVFKLAIVLLQVTRRQLMLCPEFDYCLHFLHSELPLELNLLPDREVEELVSKALRVRLPFESVLRLEAEYDQLAGEAAVAAQEVQAAAEASEVAAESWERDRQELEGELLHALELLGSSQTYLSALFSHFKAVQARAGLTRQLSAAAAAAAAAASAAGAAASNALPASSEALNPDSQQLGPHAAAPQTHPVSLPSDSKSFSLPDLPPLPEPPTPPEPAQPRPLVVRIPGLEPGADISSMSTAALLSAVAALRKQRAAAEAALMAAEQQLMECIRSDNAAIDACLRGQAMRARKRQLVGRKGSDSGVGC